MRFSSPCKISSQGTGYSGGLIKPIGTSKESPFSPDSPTLKVCSELAPLYLSWEALQGLWVLSGMDQACTVIDLFEHLSPMVPAARGS